MKGFNFHPKQRRVGRILAYESFKRSDSKRQLVFSLHFHFIFFSLHLFFFILIVSRIFCFLVSLLIFLMCGGLVNWFLKCLKIFGNSCCHDMDELYPCCELWFLPVFVCVKQTPRCGESIAMPWNLLNVKNYQP